MEGILDFGDVQYSCYVFELAVAMTYAMLLTGELRAGGLVLAGYTVSRRLPEHEYRLLKTLVAARLVQSLVLGAHAAQLDPANAYVRSTERAGGWRLLRDLRRLRAADLPRDPRDWRAVADDYLTRS